MKKSIKTVVALSMALSVCMGLAVSGSSILNDGNSAVQVAAASESLEYTDANGLTVYYKVNDKDNNTVVITGVDKTAKGKIVLPSKIIEKSDVEGTDDFEYTVTEIGSEAFSGDAKIEEVVIPDTVTTIGYKAFYQMQKLKTINIPDSVTDFGSNWGDFNNFSNCKALASVTIGSGVKQLPRSAFSGCTSLSEINFSEGLETISESAFYNCKNISIIKLPESLTEIGNSAFGNCGNLKSIEIPAAVTSIGYKCFADCSNLTAITLKEGLVSVGAECFSGCKSLKEAVFPDSFTTFGTNWGDANTFSGCITLNKIVIGKGVETIPDKFANDCISLKTVDTGSVVSIGNSAFSGCKTLSDLKLSENLAEIGNSAFADCVNLSKITMPETLKTLGYSAFSGCTSLAEITLNNELTSIGSKAFEGTAITELTIPDSVTSFGVNSGNSYLVSKCNSLKTLKIGKGITEIPGRLCSNAPALSEVTMGGNVVSIGEYAFAGTAIETIKLPDTLTTISSYAFSNTQLKTIEIPASVTGISYGAFSDNAQLERVTYQNNAENTAITFIGSQAFANCSKLNFFIVPTSTIEINSFAFSKCTSLDHIAISSNTVTIGDNLFSKGNENITVYGYDKSFAQSYAQENKLKFAIIPEKTAYSKVFDGMKSETPDDSKTEETNIIAENIEANCMTSLGGLSDYKSLKITSSQKNGYIYIFDENCQKIGDIKLNGSESYSVDLEKLADSGDYKIMITAGKIDKISADSNTAENNSVLPVSVAGGGYDVNGDGEVDTADALQILKKVVGLI